MFLYVATIAYAFYRGRVSAATAEEREYVTGGSVLCPHCETENEPEYKFCRECVGEHCSRRRRYTPGHE